jgi:hypothetical protein
MEVVLSCPAKDNFSGGLVGNEPESGVRQGGYPNISASTMAQRQWYTGW